MEINNKIKKTRKEKGFKQIEFAEKANISVRALQNYEAGERLPDVLTWCLIGKKLGLEKITELEELFQPPRKNSSSKKSDVKIVPQNASKDKKKVNETIHSENNKERK